MIEDSSEEFLTTSSGEGGGLRPPLSQEARHGVSPTPITTTLWMENAPTTHAMTAVPPRMATPWPDTGLPFEQRCAHQEGQRAQAHARQPNVEQKVAQWRSKLTGRQAATVAQPRVSPRHEPALEAERVLMLDFASTQG
jgi:hypothetical protein